MKRMLPLLLSLLLALPVCVRAEIILFEDENGQVILEDDGSVGFRPPEDNEQNTDAPMVEETFTPRPADTPIPASKETRLREKYGLHTPLPLPDKTLQYGDSGSHVLAAQERLTYLGYYHGKCSGDYLEGTQSAVRRFQKYNGFPETGKLDVPTWVVMFSAEATARDGSNPDATPSPVPTPSPVLTPEPFTYTRKLQYGDSGDLVARLQSRLAQLGFYDAKVSGGYYQITQSAVRAFQAHNGLVCDGVAGQRTQEMLFSDQAVPVTGTPRPSPVPAPTKYTLMVDVTNQLVRAYTYDENGEYTVLVREMICSTGTSKNPTPLGTTIMPKKRARWGYFPTWDSHAQYLTRIDSANAFHSVLYSYADESTLSVKSFEDLGTPASHGCVRLYVSDAKWIYDNCGEGTIITVHEAPYDPEYTMTLKRALNTETLRERSLPSPTATPLYSPENWPQEYRVLSRGSKGADVFMVQMRLAELGYYKGTVTGGYYGGTIEAVKAFQRDRGLDVDGAAGAITQAALFAIESTPTPQPAATPAPTASPDITALPSPSPTAFPAPTIEPAPEPYIPVLIDSVG